jgi:hypothetical protein
LSELRAQLAQTSPARKAVDPSWVHTTACTVERLAMSSTPVSSLALIGVQLDCIGVALKEVLARIETARIAAAQAAEHETSQAEQA